MSFSRPPLGLSLGTINFKLYEFDCKCGKCEPDAETVGNIQLLMSVLQLLRGFINEPIKINSGYRCAEHNSNVSGGAGSRHLVGLAADVSTVDWSDWTKEKVENWLVYNGIFWIRYSTHIHLDLRNQVQVSLNHKED